MNRFLKQDLLSLCTGDVSDVGDVPAADLNLPLCGGATPLVCAIERDDVDAAQALLFAGADPNQMDLRGGIPLVYAAQTGKSRFGRMLITAGADPNGLDINRRSAVHYTLYLGHIRFASYLFDNGATFDLVDADGRSPLDYARADNPGKDVKLTTEFAEMAGARNNPSGCPMPSPMRADPDYVTIDHFARKLQFDALVSHSGLWTGIFIAGLFISAVVNSLRLGGTYLDFLVPPLPIGALIYLIAVLFIVVPVWRAARGVVDVPANTDIAGTCTNGRSFADETAQSRTSARAVAEILKIGSPMIIQNFSETVHAQGLARLAYPLVFLLLLLAPCLLAVSAFVTGSLAVELGLPILDSLGSASDAFFNAAWPIGVLLTIIVGAAGASLAAVLIYGPGFLTIFGTYWLSVQALATHIRSRQKLHAKQLERELDGRTYEDRQRGNVLFLRAFSHDGMFTIGGFNLEALLVFVLSKQTSVVSLGHDPGKIGPAGLAATSKNWRDKIDRLAKNAGLILLIPWDSEGVLWEIEYLRRRHFISKTIFIAPPSDERQDIAVRWDQIRQHPKLMELEIPPYCVTGFLFSLTEGGKLKTFGPLGLDVAPLPILTEPVKYPGEDTDDDHIDVGGGDGGDGGGVTQQQDGGASAQAAPASLVTSMASLNASMQAVQILTAEQFASHAAGDGNDGGGDDSGGADGGG